MGAHALARTATLPSSSHWDGDTSWARWDNPSYGEQLVSFTMADKLRLRWKQRHRPLQKIESDDDSGVHPAASFAPPVIGVDRPTETAGQFQPF